jgi:ESF2/ABP1 family protein
MDTINDDEDETTLIQEAKEFREKVAKRGVIYMSRVPPFMKPNKARTLFEQYGEVTRLFLQEESADVRRKRKAHGGNGSKQFVEGWVEFADKNIAKSVAESLNGYSIGGKKGDFYHDDIWTLKYLKKFKWEYLTEKLAYERRVRENKLRAGMMQSKRENAAFAEAVEKSKVEKHIAERKRSREQRDRDNDNQGSYETSTGNGSVQSESHNGAKKPKKLYTFKQSKPIAMNYGENAHKIDKSVLKSILGRTKTDTS